MDILADIKPTDLGYSQCEIAGTSNFSKPEMPVVSIVVPAKDEQDNIQPLLSELIAIRSQIPPSEIIYVDDASLDNTLAELWRARAEFIPDLIILSHEQSIGQSMALMSGVRAARGQLIVTLDADGQNVPGDIPCMVSLALQEPEDQAFCIIGYRKQRKDTRWKKFQSRIANRVRQAILRDDTPDTGCALKVIPRNTWLQLPAFDHMHRFMPALVQQMGGQVRVREVRHRQRLSGRSKYGMLDRLGSGLVDLLGVVWLRRRTQITRVTVVSNDQRQSTSQMISE